MKTRVLFSVALMAIATVASAQLPQASSPEKVSMKRSQTFKQTNKTAVSEKTLNPVERVTTRANGVSYYMPNGTFWMGFDKEAKSYPASVLFAPAWTPITFVNASDDPSSTKWTIKDNDVSDFVEDNNLTYTFPINEKNRPWVLPTVSKGKTSFTIGEHNSEGQGLMTLGDGETALSTTDKSGKIYSGNQTSDGKKTYIYGSDVSHEGVTMSTMLITLPKPAAPLCVSNIFYPIISVNTKTLLPEGTKMTLKIKNMEYDAEGNASPGDKVLYEMTCGKDDIQEFPFFSDIDSYILVFSNKIEDPISHEMVDEPFMLNEAVCLELSGFDQEGIDIGLLGVDTTEGFAAETNTYMIYPNEPESFYRYSGLNALCTITGYFNVVRVDETAKKMKAPAEGGLAVTDDGGYPFAGVFTLLDWSEENFWFEPALPDWINVNVDQSNRDEYGYYAYEFECDPLPNGEAGRSWTGSLKSFCSTSEDFTIYQGEYVGINTATQNNNEVKVVNVTEDAYILEYPESVNNVAIINVAGQTITTYDLPASGNFTLPTTKLNKGIYLLRFNNNQTIKVAK